MAEGNTSLFKRLYRNGVRPDMPPRERKGMIFNNINIFFYLLAFMSGALFQYYIIGITPFFWMLTLMAFAFIPIYILNGAGYFTMTIIITTIIGTTGIFISAAILGQE